MNLHKLPQTIQENITSEHTTRLCMQDFPCDLGGILYNTLLLHRDFTIVLAYNSAAQHTFVTDTVIMITSILQISKLSHRSTAVCL